MIGAMEKGVKAAKLASPPAGEYEGVNLRILPQYICYRAALVREKTTLQTALLVAIGVLVLYFAISRFEIHSLYGELRRKEFILAPGVEDFTAASPQTVSDSYVQSAVSDFLNRLGNVNPLNITEQYGQLAEMMTPQLKVRFQMEAGEWISKVKTENVSEIMIVLDRKIEADDRGAYRAVARTRTESYVNHEPLGTRDEVIEMKLSLVPPTKGKRWYLELTSLTRMPSDASKAKDSLEKPNGRKG